MDSFHLVAWSDGCRELGANSCPECTRRGPEEQNANLAATEKVNGKRSPIGRT